MRVFFFYLCVLLPSFSTHAQISDNFPILKPQLIINENPKLCEGLLKIVENSYLSEETSPRVISPAISYDMGMEADAENGGPREYQDWFGYKRVVFQPIKHRFTASNGESYLIEQPAHKIAGEYDIRKYFVVGSTGLAGEIPLTFSITSFLGKIKPLYGFSYNDVAEDEVPVIDTENISQSGETISYENVIPIIFENEYYFVWAERRGKDLIQPLIISKFEITQERQNKFLTQSKVCETAILRNESLNTSSDNSYLNYLPELTAMNDLLKTAQRIAGNDRPSKHGDNVQKLWTAILRPWVFNNLALAKTERIEDLFKGWKHLGPWEYRQYKILNSSLDLVESQMVEIYTRRFGMDGETAINIANSSLNRFHNNLVGGQYEQYLYRRRTGVDVAPSAAVEFRRLLLGGSANDDRDIAKFLEDDTHLHLEQKFEMTKYQDSFPVFEQAIFYALESDNNAGLTFLINHGVDLNTTNWFGKTPLMFAAHLNNFTAVKTLLENNVLVNLSTGNYELPRYGRYDDPRYFQVHIRNRTALMYAAENASLKLFRLLIEAGADVEALDSAGRTIRDYLSLNETMSKSEMEDAIKLLVEEGA